MSRSVSFAKPQACPKCGKSVYLLAHQRTHKFAYIDADPSAKGNLSLNLIAFSYDTVIPEYRLHTKGAMHVAHALTCPALKHAKKGGAE